MRRGELFRAFLIIAARFDTFDRAQGAADALMKEGVNSEDMHTFFVNPAGAHARMPIGGDRVADPGSKGAPYAAFGGAAILAVVGAIIGALIGFSLNNAVLPVVGGAGVGAYIGSLIGGVSRLGRSEEHGAKAVHDGVHEYVGRPSGVLLAVRVDAGQQPRIANLLTQAGGIEIERAEGRWENGQWRDFDPLSEPDGQDIPAVDRSGPTQNS